MPDILPGTKASFSLETSLLTIPSHKLASFFNKASPASLAGAHLPEF